MVERYNPFEIEPKWQKNWQNANAFKSTEDKTKPKQYVLSQFPYPSGKLHIGHLRVYTIGDLLSRYYRLKGYSVLQPMGWDAFGMPAENAAIKNGTHPKKWTYSSINAMKQTMDLFGLSYDWDREIATCDELYYGQQQKMFIDLHSKGLVYQKEALVNWDPVDMTVLANEQVIDGKGWRSDAPVERRSMTQWFLKITQYADELLDGLKTLSGWPERVKTMQENWIGKSEGLTFSFQIKNHEELLEVYTTRPDTMMGITFCSIAPEHQLADLLAEHDTQAADFIKKCQAQGTSQVEVEKAEKLGYKTPYVAIHPITGVEIPIYIANFVLMGYGTGAVMAVPAHDERDYAFAVKYNIPIKQVIEGKDMPKNDAYVGDGVLINSGEFDGLTTFDAKEAVITKMETIGKGKRTTNYRLRDWGISRQRYWGCPIPFIVCKTCGTVPVPADQLPVKLPEDVKFDKPGNPLEHHPTWKHVDCPCCGKKAKRVTDTMDTFMDSSWYFLRYTAPEASEPIVKDKCNYWMQGGVDKYVGGIEHAVLHLLYSRFLTRAMRDCGYIDLDEPFNTLITQGMVIGNSYQTTNGDYINPVDVEWQGEKAFYKGHELKINRMEKMSKSKNNGVDPLVLLEKYGADTSRLFMMFTAPPERDLEWSDTAIEGSWRFIGRLWNLLDVATNIPLSDFPTIDSLHDKLHRDMKRKIHQTIRKVGVDIEKFQFNTMISAVMELSNQLANFKVSVTGDDIATSLYREGVEACVRLLNPVAPHVTEEMWQKLGHSTPLTTANWPEFDKKAAQDDEVTLVVQVNGKLKSRLTIPVGIPNAEAEKLALAAVDDLLAGLTVRKCIVIPNRLVNVVAS